jgi:hypothetical protein
MAGARTFLQVQKDMTVGDVHVEESLGGGKKPKKPVLGEVGKLVDGRHLKPIDDNHSHVPFPYDATALGNIRPDQAPRFFGALTDSDKLDTKTVDLDSLVAMQNRVDTGKVEAARGWQGGKLPVVVRMTGRDYIADGHHRLSAAYLNGDKQADVRFLDLTPVSNAVKAWAVPMRVAKVDADQQLIFGWASVVEKDGYLIIDKQEDIILPETLEEAAYDFVLHARDHGDMHKDIGTGRLIESMVFTKEKQAALGINLGQVGWWTGFKVDNAEVWAAHKRGERPEFSIGGKAQSIEV